MRAELTLPATLAIVDASVVGGSCTSGGGAVECELGEIAGGNVRTIELELSSDSPARTPIVAHVTADHDSDRTDNDGSGTIVVEPPADVSVTLRGPASCDGEREIHRRLRRREHRRGQRRNRHGEDRHPGGHHGPQRLAD